MAAAGPAAAESRPKSVISEPYDQRPGAITRPAGKPDRAARRGRRSPELVMTPQRPIGIVGGYEGPRYGPGGRRLDVPGRPDTYDAIGRQRRYAPRAGTVVQPMGPTVRTDAPTRINQFPPR